MSKINNLEAFLTSQANAIRTVKGTTSKINAQDMESEILNIETGINPEGEIEITEDGTYDVTNYASAKVNVPIPDGYIKPEEEIKITENGSYDVTEYESANVNIKDKLDLLLVDQLEEYSNEEVTIIRKYSFSNKSNLKSLNLPNVTTIGEYSIYYTGITDLNLPKLTTIPSYGLAYNKSLETLYLPELISTSAYAIDGCSALKVINLPKLATIASYWARSCDAIEKIYLPIIKNIPANAFVSKKITDVYLEYDGVVTLSNTANFNGCNAAKIHVKNSYASQYPEATNWSALVADGNVVIIGHFTIGDVDYTAEPTMTWTHWVDSVHNTIGLEIVSYNGEEVVGTTSKVIVDVNGNLIKATDPLDQNTYSLVSTDDVNTDLITFTINGTTYQAGEGMTWEDWVDSEYNSDGYYCDSENISVFTGSNMMSIVVLEDGYSYLSKTDTITSGYKYKISTGGSN